MSAVTKNPTRKESGLERFVSFVTLRGPMHRFDRWLGRKLKIDFYELDGSEVVGPKGRRFRVQDLRSWQEVFIGMGVSFVVTEFADGRTIDWSDKYEHLLAILRRVAPERELPWTAQ